ncbi:hypothetical protein ACMBCN_02080, partial [Candidatus Liberibacter asiaticus]|nr:hypothetical protein [Candidatus Liberibacter asiaticus]
MLLLPQVSRITTQRGNFGSAFISSTSNTWFIDSGVTDHMTSNPPLFDSLTPSCVMFIQVAYRTPKSILISHYHLHFPCPILFLHL